MKDEKYSVKALKIVCYLFLIIGIFFTYSTFFGRFDLVSGSIGMVSGNIAAYAAFIVLASTLVLLKLKDKRKNERFYNTIAIIGVICTISLLLPLIFTPISISTGEEAFSQTFGEDWEERIPEEIEYSFSNSTYNLERHFLGSPSDRAELVEDVKYYEDEEIELYFDVHLPPENIENLPGSRDTIIKIHGGAWMYGDKGVGNTLPNSQYLASQGYVVFDVQYGLRDEEYGWFTRRTGTPTHKMGDFTVVEQVEHLGIFSQRLQNEYAERYDADLNNVYTMGGSAGGHLSSLFGYGYSEDYFDNVFADELNIVGVIPLYPAVDSVEYFHETMPGLLPGSPEDNEELYHNYDPSNLISENDPPAIIFQGTSDGLTPPDQAAKLEKALEEKGIGCVKMSFPFAGHVNDFFFNANFNQVWTYYLERFLFLT